MSQVTNWGWLFERALPAELVHDFSWNKAYIRVDIFKGFTWRKTKLKEKHKQDLNCLQSYKTTQLSWGSVILKWGVKQDKGTKEKEKFEETSKTKKTKIQTRNTPM